MSESVDSPFTHLEFVFVTTGTLGMGLIFLRGAYDYPHIVDRAIVATLGLFFIWLTVYLNLIFFRAKGFLPESANQFIDAYLWNRSD